MHTPQGRSTCAALLAAAMSGAAAATAAGAVGARTVRPRRRVTDPLLGRERGGAGAESSRAGPAGALTVRRRVAGAAAAGPPERPTGRRVVPDTADTSRRGTDAFPRRPARSRAFPDRRTARVADRQGGTT